MYQKILKDPLITETKNLSVISSNKFNKNDSFYLNNPFTKFTYLGSNKVEIEDTHSQEKKILTFNPDKTYSIRMYDYDNGKYYTSKIKFEKYSKMPFSYLNVKSEEPTTKTIIGHLRDSVSFAGYDDYSGTQIVLVKVLGDDENKKSNVALGYLETNIKYEKNKKFNILGNYFKIEKINYSVIDEEKHSDGRVIVNPINLDVYNVDSPFSDLGSYSIISHKQGESFYIRNSNKVTILKIYTEKNKKYVDIESNVSNEKRFYSFESDKVGSLDFSRNQGSNMNPIYNSLDKFDIVFNINEKNEVSHNIVKERKNLQVGGSLVIYDPLSKTNISCIIELISLEINNTGHYIHMNLLPLYPSGAFDKKTQKPNPFLSSEVFEKLPIKVPIK
jgi:hypothetical protein